MPQQHIHCGDCFDARQKQIAVNENVVREPNESIGAYIESWRERALQEVGIPG